MKKYDVRFCDCGRVHFIEEEKIDEAIRENKEVLVVCNNCGDSFVIGANTTLDDNGEVAYMMYSRSLRDTVVEDMPTIDRMIFTSGERIIMMTGKEATYHGSHKFIDFDTKKPENISESEWEKLRETVNTKHTINWIKDEDKLEHLSHYYSGISWKDTKYEKSYNR